MNGFRQELLGRILGLNGELGIHGAPLLTDFDTLAARVRGVPGVVAVMPVVESAAGLKAEQGTFTGGVVRGIRKDDLRQVHVVGGQHPRRQPGQVRRATTPSRSASGWRLGSAWHRQPPARLISPQGRRRPRSARIPRVRAYTVVAIFQVGINEYDTGFVFLPLDAAQIFFQ